MNSKLISNLTNISKFSFSTMVFSLLLALTLFMNWQIFAAEEIVVDDHHSGVISPSAGFEIFPQGRLGNAVYRDKKFLFSFENVILDDILSLDEDGYVYKGMDANGKEFLGYFGSENNVFLSVSPGYYELKIGKYKKKLFRINPKGKIHNLLPYSNTATGITVGKNGQAVFFHINKGEEVEDVETGKKLYKYYFRVHVIYPNQENIKTLPKTFEDFKPNLRLHWLNKYNFSIQFSDGKQESVKVP